MVSGKVSELSPSVAWKVLFMKAPTYRHRQRLMAFPRLHAVVPSKHSKVHVRGDVTGVAVAKRASKL